MKYLIGSYLSTFQETLRKHYQRHALMRDGDTMDVFIRYLTGIEIYRFNLALNSGLLNRWSTGPLSLAGLCTIERPQSEAAPSMAIDAASLITENGQVCFARLIILFCLYRQVFFKSDFFFIF